MSEEAPLSDSPSGGGELLDDDLLCGVSDTDALMTASDCPPKITEQEALLASDAARVFAEKSFEESHRMMETLSELRPEDPLVQLNKAVVGFEAKALSVDRLEIELKKVYNKLAIHAGADLEDSEHWVLYYNLALVAFIKRRFVFAETILKNLWDSLEVGASSAAPPSSSSAAEEASFSMKHVCPLLVATLLAQKKPASAVSVMNAAVERKQPNNDVQSYPTSSRAILDRALALVQSKQYKAFKRDVKPSQAMAGADLTTYEFLRANLEFFKGNHRKATKLLSLGMQQNADQASAMFANNLGCINVMLGKANLGVFYLEKALALHSAELAKGNGQSPRKDLFLRSKKAEIVYNVGLALLHAGRPEAAFEVLSQTAHCFATSPSLWLHLAECCIQRHLHQSENLKLSGSLYGAPSDAADPSSSGSPEVVSLGSQAHRKLVLNPNRTPKKDESKATLDFASVCLKNASQLVEALKDSEEFAHQPPQGNNGKSGGGGSTQSSPVKVPSIPRNGLLKASVLLDRAYVSLSLSDPVIALEHAQNLLQLDNLSSGFRMLGNLYAADALIQLDRISDAMAHLDPTRVGGGEVTFANVVAQDEEGGGGPKKSPSECSTVSRALLQHNFIVAFVLRGELDKAEEMLGKLWVGLERSGSHEMYGMRIGLVSLRMYVALAKGNVEACRQICKQNFPVVALAEGK